MEIVCAYIWMDVYKFIITNMLFVEAYVSSY